MRKIFFAVALLFLAFAFKAALSKPVYAATQGIVGVPLTNTSTTMTIHVTLQFSHNGTAGAPGTVFSTKIVPVAPSTTNSWVYSDLDFTNAPYYWVVWSTSCSDPPAFATYSGTWGTATGPGVAAWQANTQDVTCNTPNATPYVTNTACASVGWGLTSVGQDGPNIDHFELYLTQNQADLTNNSGGPSFGPTASVGSGTRSYDFGSGGKTGTYYFRIRAVSPQGVGSWTPVSQFNCGSAVVPASLSGVFTSCITNDSSSLINGAFGWTPASGGSGFNQQWLDVSVANNGFAPGPYLQSANVGVGVSSYTTGTNVNGTQINAMAQGTRYYWRVNTQANDNNWYPSTTGSFVTPTCTSTTSPPPTIGPTPTPQPGSYCPDYGCTGPSYTFPSVSRPNSYWTMWGSACGGYDGHVYSGTTAGLSASVGLLSFCGGETVYWHVQPVSSSYSAMRGWDIGGQGTVTAAGDGSASINWSWEYTMCIHLTGYNCGDANSRTQQYHVTADSSSTFSSHTFSGLNGNAAYQANFCAAGCSFGSYITTSSFTSGPCNCPPPTPTPTPVPPVITLSGFSDCSDGVNAKVHLTWTSNTGSPNYIVFRDGVNQATLGNVRSWDSTTSQPSGAHNWMVQGTVGSNPATNSNTISITTATCTPPPADPSNLIENTACDASGNPTITFTWKNNATGESGFWLDVSHDAFTGPSSTTASPSVWGVKGIVSSVGPGTGVQFLWNNAVTTNTAGQLDSGDTDSTVPGNQLAPEKGVVYYWRVTAFSSSQQSNHVYPNSTDGSSDTTTPPGVSFTTPTCNFDLQVSNPPSGNIQTYAPGATATFTVRVTNTSAGQVAYPGGGVLGAWTLDNTPTISCPGTGVTPSGANTQSISLPSSIAVGAYQDITLTGFAVPSTPGTHIAYFYALPTCSPNNDSNWTNNGFELAYAVSAQAWFDTVGGDVGARGTIQVANPSVPANSQSTYALTGNPLGSNVKGNWALNNYSQPLFPSDNSGVYNYFASRFRSQATQTLCSVAPPAGGGLAFDSVATPASSTTSTVTWSHTVGASSNRLLLVGVSIRGTATVSSVTYGGATLSSVGGYTNGGIRVEMWRLLAPASGTNTITVTLSAAATVVADSTSWSGVNQTTPLGTFASAGGFSTSPSVNVTSASGEMVADVVSMPYASTDAAPTPGAGQTQRWNLYGTGDIRGFASDKAGASSVTMSWTTKNEQWAIGGISIKPVSAGGSMASGDISYQCTTNATAGGDLSSITGNWVVFVDGNLTVNNNLILNNNSTIVFVVAGNITVNTNVTRIDGVYITAGTFADYDTADGQVRNTFPYWLQIIGAVYAHQFDLSAFLSNLPACNPRCTNSIYPTDVVVFQPRYLVTLSNMIGSPTVSWQEVAP